MPLFSPFAKFVVIRINLVRNIQYLKFILGVRIMFAENENETCAYRDHRINKLHIPWFVFFTTKKSGSPYYFMRNSTQIFNIDFIAYAQVRYYFYPIGAKNCRI